jgi:hypothetical protein
MYNSRNKDKVRQYQSFLKRKEAKDSFKLPANKKKIRNWPTLITRLETLKQEHLFHSLDEMISALTDADSFYMKLYIDPFYRIIKRNPPLWFRKLFIQALCDVYENWQRYAKQLDTPYYLKIWIFEPSFTQSQIVLGIGERIKWYENLFDAHEKNIPFPDQYKSDSTGKFNWDFAKEIDVVEKDYFSNKEWKKFIAEKKIWKTDKLKDVDPEVEYYLFHAGDVWIGDMH